MTLLRTMTLNKLTQNSSISIYATESVITELFKEPCPRIGLWYHKFCPGLYKGFFWSISAVFIAEFSLLSTSISRKSYLRSETDYKAKDGLASTGLQQNEKVNVILEAHQVFWLLNNTV